MLQELELIFYRKEKSVDSMFSNNLNTFRKPSVQLTTHIVCNWLYTISLMTNIYNVQCSAVATQLLMTVTNNITLAR